jgi:peptide/nickel transport system substrate-binding protein
MNRRATRISFVLVMLFAFFSLPVFAAETIVSAKDSMVVIIPNDPGSLDPHDNVMQVKHQSLRQVYETLVVYDETGKLVPWLAEKWEYEDDVTLVLHIRKGVKFHNGDELKASDVMFTLKRFQDDNTPAAMQVDQVDFDKSVVVDDYTMKLVTIAPYALQLPMLENPLASIVSERSYKESNKDFNKAPIGTGPYKVVEYRSGDNLKLEGFDQYWIPGQPYVKHLTIRYIADASSRAMEAESGGSDIVYEISANEVDRIRANPDINLVSAMGANTSYLTMNQLMKPLDDIRVRQALWYAVDIPQAIKVAYGNYGEVASGVISPGIDGRHPDLSRFFPKQDIEKAKSLLKEAGYENGFEIEYACEAMNQQRKDFGEVIQAQLAKVGIKVIMNVMDATQFSSSLSAGERYMAAYGYTASTGEAGRVLFRWMPDKTEFPIFSWTNQQYIDTIAKALVTVDSDARNELYYKCQEMLMENFVALPIWHKELNAACTPQVRGFRITPSYEQHYLQYVYFVE